MDRRREAVLQRTVRDQRGRGAARRGRTAVEHDRRMLRQRLVHQLHGDLRSSSDRRRSSTWSCRPLMPPALLSLSSKTWMRVGFLFTEERGAAGDRQDRVDLVGIGRARAWRERATVRQDKPRPARPYRAVATSSFAAVVRRFEMAAEAEAHRRENLVLEFGFAARTEARVERGREHRRRHGLVDRRL